MSEDMIEIKMTVEGEEVLLEYISPEHQICAIARKHYQHTAACAREQILEYRLSDAKNGLYISPFPDCEIGLENGHYRLQCQSSDARKISIILAFPKFREDEPQPEGRVALSLRNKI